MAVGHFRSTAEAIAATGDAMAQDADVGRAAGPLHPRPLAPQARVRARSATILEGDPDALLFVELDGDDRGRGQSRALDALEAAWSEHGHGYHTLRADDAGRPGARCSKVRKAGLGLLMAASRGSRRPLAFVEDTAVPPERLERLRRRLQGDPRRATASSAGFYGHCSVGCLHIRPFVDLRAAGEVDVMREVAEEVAELVLRYGGVNAREHGDGLVRSPFNRRMFGDELYEAMREVKRAVRPATGCSTRARSSTPGR